MKQIYLSSVPPEREQFRQHLLDLYTRLAFAKIAPYHRTIIEKWLKEQELKSLQDEQNERKQNKEELRKSDADFRRKHPHEAFCSSVMKDAHICEEIQDCQHELKMLANSIEDADDERTVQLLTQEQKQIEYTLRLLYKFSADESIRKDIEEKTAALAAEWARWKESEWIMREDGIIGINEDGSYRRGKTLSPKSHGQLAEGIRHTLKVYKQMCNTYAQMPSDCVSMQEILKLLAQGVKVSADEIAKASERATENFKQVSANLEAVRVGVATLVNNIPGSNRPSTIQVSDAISIMAKVCGSDAVSERTIQRWLRQGKASKANLKIDYDDLSSVSSWNAWCESYRAQMTNRLKCREYLSSKHPKG